MKEPIKAILTENLLITESGKLVEIRSQRTSNKIKDLLLSYSLQQVHLSKLADSPAHSLVCAVEHDLVIFVQMDSLDLESAITAAVGQSHIKKCEKIKSDGNLVLL